MPSFLDRVRPPSRRPRRAVQCLVVLAAGAGGVGLALLPAAFAANQSVTAGGTQLRFSPETVAVKPGETVTWTNAGGTHNVHFDDTSLSCQMPATPQPPSGWGGGTGKVSCTFPRAGTFTYHCDLHQSEGMTGTVIVNDSGTVPGTTTSPTPSTTTTPYPGPTPAPTTSSNPSTGAAGGSGAPVLSDLQAKPHQRRHVSGQVVIGQSGSQFEAQLLRGQTAPSVAGAADAARSRASSGPAGAAATAVLGKTLKSNVPAGTLQFQVALNRRGRALVKRKGKVKALLEVIVTPPGGPRKVASARITMTAR